MPAWLVLKVRQAFPNTEMPIFFLLQIQNIVARLFLVLENLILECCVMYSGYVFGRNILPKALSGLGVTAPIARRLAGVLLWNKMNGVDVHSSGEP